MNSTRFGTTTILGVDYAGRPMMNSDAFRIRALEEAGDLRNAEAHKRFCDRIGHNLADDFTPFDQHGFLIWSAEPAAKLARAA